MKRLKKLFQRTVKKDESLDAWKKLMEDNQKLLEKSLVRIIPEEERLKCGIPKGFVEIVDDINEITPN